MNQNAVVPFENAPLPAHLQQFSNVISGDDLTAGASGGFPVISIKGKVFHVVRGDERVLVTRPDGAGEPAGSIEMVLLKANPALSKIYYEKSYEEGSDDKPTCYSTDGVAPAADAQAPQSQKCAACPHNVWGSRITDNGGKGKACADSRRLAVAPVGQLNDVMLLRVPAASLKPLAQYGDLLKKRGVAYPMVSTLISFDWNVAHPALTFKPMGFLSDVMAREVMKVLQSDLPSQVAGVNLAAAAPAQVAAPAPQQLPAPQPQVAPQPQPQAQVIPMTQAPAAPKQQTKKAAAPRAAAPAPAAAPQQRPATVSFGGTAAPQPQAQAARPPAQQVQIVDDELTRELGSVLAAAGFDDAAQ